MKKNLLNRRKFFSLLGTGGAILATRPVSAMADSQYFSLDQEKALKLNKPATNIADAAKVPRTETSMPGKFPGKVVHIKNSRAVINDEPVEKEAYQMIEKAMLELTGQNNLKKAWRMFVSPGEKIGLKVNPLGGKLISTSHAVVKSVIKQLLESGIEKENIIIWDRRPVQFKAPGFTAENYPDIRIIGTEEIDENGSFYDKDGKLLSLKNLDREWYYYADIDSTMTPQNETTMMNDGKYSYFTTIVTRELDKIINLPVLKSHGMRITNAMKNLTYGVLSNTPRLHNILWDESCCEPCAFAPLRDKVVLTISDALRASFRGNHPTNPAFVYNVNSIFVGTDAVAIDRVSWEILLEKRIAEGLANPDTPKIIPFMTMASDLGLGVSDIDKIDLALVDMG